MKERFYVLEGLDGVGKSTTVEGLRASGLSVIKTPPDGLAQYRELFDGTDVRLRFLYYLTGVYIAGRQAEKITASEEVFCDRYLLTTVAAHELMGAGTFLTACLPIIRKLPVPEKTVLIIADERERIRRLEERGMNQIDRDNFAINTRLLEGYRRWAEALEHPLIEVDNTHLTPQETIEAVLEAIHE